MLICMKLQVNNKCALIIYGPTGVGKTEIALTIAEHHLVEIINMDVGQFYTPLTIGTAKPDWKNLSTPHHLFDVINTSESITVSEYRKMVIELVDDIIKRNKIPILVGGSGFYLRSLLFPLKETEPNNHQATFFDKDQNLWEQLYAIDPQRALSISKSDTYRLERALQIWHTLGKKPTEYEPEYNPPFDFLLLNVMRDVEDLNKRINMRVVEMVQSGWIQEVEGLLNTPWHDFIRHKKIIGYNEILNFLTEKHDGASLARTIEIIQNKTRQYAKRQRTFWRKLEREIKQQSFSGHSYIGCIQSINLTHQTISVCSNELVTQLQYIGKKNE